MDMTSLAVRLFGIIGIAAVVALAVHRFHDALRPILPDQQAGAGVAVIGLIVVGLATSQGVRAHWLADPGAFDLMLAAAFAVNVGLCAVGTVVFAWLGLRSAATIGLVSGNRNVTLAWAAASLTLPDLAEGYVAACVVPVLALPLIIKMSLAGSAFVSRRIAEHARAGP
jgi:hypothetical protein